MKSETLCILFLEILEYMYLSFCHSNYIIMLWKWGWWRFCYRVDCLTLYIWVMLFLNLVILFDYQVSMISLDPSKRSTQTKSTVKDKEISSSKTQESSVSLCSEINWVYEIIAFSLMDIELFKEDNRNIINF